MEIKFIATLIIALLNIFLGVFIYRKNRQNPGNINYAGMCVSGGLWALSMAALLLVSSQGQLDIVAKLTYIFGMLPPLFYVMFAYHYPYRLWVYPKFLIRLIYTIALALILFSSLGTINFEISVFNNGVYTQQSVWPGFLIFAIYFFAYIIWGLFILFKKFHRIEGIYRINIKYLIAATFSTFIITGTTSVILPLLWTFAFDWLGPIFTLVHFTIVGYLIFIKSRAK